MTTSIFLVACSGWYRKARQRLAFGDTARARPGVVSRSTGLALGATGCLCLPAAAWAQGAVISQPILAPDAFSTLVTPVLSPDYSRDHNVGALEQGQPDYEAAGIAVGSFSLFPAMTLGAVGNNNVYASASDLKGDISSVIKPSLDVTSDWSRHKLQLQAYGDFRQYATQSMLNRNSWSVNPLTELDFGSRFVLHIEGEAGRFFENPYNSDIGPQAQVLSTFFRTGAIVKGTYTGGRVRLTAAYDRSTYSFSTIYFSDGSSVDQTYRNRTINRFSGQVELALSPSLALYSGVSADQIDYQVARDALNPKQNSSGQSLIGGVSFDLAGVMRGVVGVGYTHRSYLEAAYRSVGALSAQARLDYFPFTRTTVSLQGQRVIQDSGLSTTPYIDTRIMSQVDQLLRENVSFSVNASLARQAYIGTGTSRLNKQLQATLRYQASRWLGFQGELTYQVSTPNSAALGNNFSGVAGGLSVTVRR